MLYSNHHYLILEHFQYPHLLTVSFHFFLIFPGYHSSTTGSSTLSVYALDPFIPGKGSFLLGSLETTFHFVALTGLELIELFLPLPPKSWAHTRALPVRPFLKCSFAAIVDYIVCSPPPPCLCPMKTDV